jgi:hypothetical protein
VSVLGSEDGSAEVGVGHGEEAELIDLLDVSFAPIVLI